MFCSSNPWPVKQKVKNLNCSFPNQISGRKAGQQCCYDFNGNLLIGPPGGGTINTIAPIDTKSTSEHLEEDVLPFLYCCKAEQPYCDKYYQVRPSDNGSRYNPPNPGMQIIGYGYWVSYLNWGWPLAKMGYY